MPNVPQFFLLSRVLLRFQKKQADLRLNLSSVTFTPEGNLWVASDETLTLERLSPVAPNNYGDHQSFELADYIDLSDNDVEIDIEGLDYNNNYLWLTGSHSTKRGKARGKNPKKDIARITEVKAEVNRYLLARIPVIKGEPVKSANREDNPKQMLSTACLERTGESNALIESLRDDPHLGPYLKFPIPGKENGFDIEGLAVYKNRLFLGFRGPVLRGLAMILEIELQESGNGVLSLKPIGKNNRPYRKHFVDLDGLGVRELLLIDEDLIILAGPTMVLEGSLRVYELKDALDLVENTIHNVESNDLRLLFDLPFNLGYDHAEGLALCPCLENNNSLLIVYDAPDPERIVGKNAVYADVFRLKRC